MLRLTIITIIFSVLLLNAQTRNNANQLFRLAQTYEQAGHYKEANAIYEDLYKKNHASYTYFSAYTRTLTALKKYDDVIDLCEKKIAQNPNDLNTYGFLGGAYYLKGNEKKAYEIWDEAVKKAGNNPVNYRIMANYALQVRAVEKAIKLLEEGKRHASSPEMFNYDLANLYSMTMAYDKAMREYCELLSLKPKQYYTVKNKIGSFLYSENGKKETVSELEKCYDEHRNTAIGELLAYAYKSIGEFGKSLQLIIALDEDNDRNGKLVFSFAEEALKSNNYAVARNAFEYLSDNYEDAPFADQVKFGLAKSLAELKKKEMPNPNFWKPIKPRTEISADEFSDAIKLLNEIIAETKSAKLKEDAEFLLGKLYFETVADYAKADSVFAALSEKSASPKRKAEALIIRGKIALFNSAGDFDVAKEFFVKAKKFKNADKEKFLEAEFYLGQINFWNAKFSEAAEIFDELSRNKNNDFANDAINKKLIISMFKNDSLNLAKFAFAEYAVFIEDYEKALKLLRELGGNKNLFILNNLAKLKTAEIYIATNRYPEAVKLLETLSENNLPEIFPDKAMKELGDVYYYGMKNMKKALSVYNKFLEKFPDSLYINIIRENIKYINETENYERKK